ncbi:hypothetical protein CesoFtcFv8_007951 [Champsocephalus esox]|uniref:Uncharacterized protein n=1 Tax=Champsocephalus esox TaxID=159716 RepID=A0AAN8H4U8_9TELE|nr:hypothetical protein CesoFtcFv8_007951 [Champsocephalus esox]
MICYLQFITNYCVETLYDENIIIWGTRINEVLDTLSQIRSQESASIDCALQAALQPNNVESAEIANTDIQTGFQDLSSVESTPYIPFDTTAEPLRTHASHYNLTRDANNQVDWNLFNNVPQLTQEQQQPQQFSENFLQIPPELQADFDVCSAFLDNYELPPGQDTLLTSQTDSAHSQQVADELS